MIKILKSLKYDKTQYDKHFGIFYHMALSKYDKKKTYVLHHQGVTFLDMKLYTIII